LENALVADDDLKNLRVAVMYRCQTKRGAAKKVTAYVSLVALERLL
jgi:hypothetical protein